MPLRLPKIFRRQGKKPKTSKIELKEDVRKKAIGKEIDSWPQSGEVQRYKQIFFDILKRGPINHLIKLKNRKPNIMILGPGKGQYISELKIELAPYKIDPKIDVLGLQKTIDGVLLNEKTVRNDFSRGKALEEIYTDLKANKRLISKLKERYDLVMAPASVGLHTFYPAFNVFNVSCMLKKGGVAYIEVPTEDLIKRPQFKVSENHKIRMLEEVSQLSIFVRNHLEEYGGKKYSEQFSFSNIDYSTTYENPNHTKTILNKRYIKVERK